MNQWTKDAIIRAYKRNLSLIEIKKHLNRNCNVSLDEIKRVVREIIE